MTLIPIQRSVLSDTLKKKALELNWIAVNIRTGIHLSRSNGECYVVHIPKDVSANYLEKHEHLFAVNHCEQRVLEGAESDQEAIDLAHFYLQATVPVASMKNGRQ
jgi:hypothetical protein